MAHYRNLKVWQASMRLASSIYKVTERLPSRERFGLTAQMRRAASSIPANIAEGKGRAGDKEFRRFLDIAYGSLMELETQIFLSIELRYLKKSDCRQALRDIADLGRMLNGLRSRLRRQADRR